MCCCPLLSSSARSPANGSVTRSPPRKRRACGWAAMCRSAMTPPTAPSSSTLPRPRRCVISSHFTANSAACAGQGGDRSPRPHDKAQHDGEGHRARRPTLLAGAPLPTAHEPDLYRSNCTQGQLYPGQHPALIDTETWTAVRDQIATNATNHRRRADAAEPSVLVGVLVDARGERFTPSHAVKKGRRYRYYVSAALITQAGADHAQGWRLPAQEIEDAVIRVLTDALTSPAMLLERFGTAGIPSDQTRKMLDRATRLATALNRSPAQRAKVVRDLIEKVVIGENAITIRIRRCALSGG